MKAAIYCKSVPGASAKAQEVKLRRLCEERGWTVHGVYVDPPGRPPKLESGKGRLALIEALLSRKRRFRAVCVWRVGMLGNAIDDILWLLEELSVKRGVHIVTIADGFDTTTGDGAVTNVIATLTRAGRTGQ